MTTIGIIPNKEDIEKNDTNKRQEVEGCTADENSNVPQLVVILICFVHP
jgi:hypothetical protein